MNEATLEEDWGIEEPQEPVDPPREKNSYETKPTCIREAILDAERYGALEGIDRERKRPRPYSSYVALLCDIIDKEPSSYEEAIEKKEWKDDMIEEYQSIMKNDVWEIVLIPKIILSWIWNGYTRSSMLYMEASRNTRQGL